MKSDYVLTVIILSALVTWFPRVAPFILTKYKSLPALAIRFLNYLPLTIIFALTLSSIMDEQVGRLPNFLPLELIAIIPTFLVAAKSRNVLLAVLVGVISMAALRFFF